MLYMKKDPSAAQHLATTSASSCQILITRLFFFRKFKVPKKIKKKRSEEVSTIINTPTCLTADFLFCGLEYNICKYLLFERLSVQFKVWWTWWPFSLVLLLMGGKRMKVVTYMWTLISLNVLGYTSPEHYAVWSSWIYAQTGRLAGPMFNQTSVGRYNSQLFLFCSNSAIKRAIGEPSFRSYLLCAFQCCCY